VVPIRELCYLRVKGGADGDTPPHRDIYYLAFMSDGLARAAQVRFGDPRVCAACGRHQVPRSPLGDSPGLRRPQLCASCGTRPIRLYTAWITLGALDLRGGARLQFMTGAMRGSLHDVTPAEALRGYAMDAIRGGRWQEIDRACVAPRTLEPGQGVIFGPRVLHRAVAGREPNIRVSLDVRFVHL
jgi:hypothetical protein